MIIIKQSLVAYLSAVVCDVLSCRIKFSHRVTRCCGRRVYQWCYQCT